MAFLLFFGLFVLFFTAFRGFLAVPMVRFSFLDHPLVQINVSFWDLCDTFWGKVRILKQPSNSSTFFKMDLLGHMCMVWNFFFGFVS